MKKTKQQLKSKRSIKTDAETIRLHRDIKGTNGCDNRVMSCYCNKKQKKKNHTQQK